MAQQKRARWHWGAALVMVAALMGGCAKPAGVVFPPHQPPLRWPGPPQETRIEYVGQLKTSADLKPAKKFLEGLAEALFGKKHSKGMLTPYAVCTDGASRVFVADSNAQLVHVFDLESRKYEQWMPGPRQKDPEKQKRFSQPVGLAYDPSGRLLVSDAVEGVVVAFDKQGNVQGELGRGQLKRPCGLAVHAATGRIYVADAELHQVVVLNSQGELVVKLGGRGTELGQFNYPTNVAIDRQGRLYVSDSLNFRIQQILPDMRTVRQIGSKGDLPGYFAQPKGIAVDSQDHLYVVDAHFEAVQIFDAEGKLLMDFGQEGQNPGQFWLPAGIHIDPQDRLWIADSYNQRVQVFDYKRTERP